jgi:RecJ-like exonuclease
VSRTIAIVIVTDADEEVTHQLPAKNEVCDRCEGYGHHTNPNIDGNGITQSEWAEWDYEERESYMNGEYDVTCEECHGNKVVQVVDEDQCSEEQKNLFQQWAEQESERYASDAADRAYQRMECGGW